MYVCNSTRFYSLNPIKYAHIPSTYSIQIKYNALTEWITLLMMPWNFVLFHIERIPHLWYRFISSLSVSYRYGCVQWINGFAIISHISLPKWCKMFIFMRTYTNSKYISVSFFALFRFFFLSFDVLRLFP